MTMSEKYETRAKRSAIVAATPFQVLSALAIVSNRHESAGSTSSVDLYIVGGFANDIRMASRLKSRKELIVCVYFVPTDYDAYGRGMRNATDDEVARWDIFKEDNAHIPLNDENCYDELFFSLPTLTAESLADSNPSAAIALFDDGYGSYFSDLLYENGWAGRRPSRLLLLAPDMCENAMGIMPEQLVFPIDEKVFSDLANDIMDYASTGRSTKQNRVVYLSQPFSHDDLILGANAYSHVLQLLGEFEASSVVKPHPRDNLDQLTELFGGISIDVRGQSMELLCLNKEIDSDNILVASFSTAQYIPAIMFGSRPYLLFLYKVMLKDGEQKEELSAMVSHIMEIYGAHAKQRICVAESWDDASRFLRASLS